MVALMSLCFILQGYAQSHTQFFQDADAFFKKNVSNGRVKYQDIKSNPAQLNKLLDYLKTNGTLDVKGNTEKAMLINAYNIFVFKGIVDNYPIESPLKKGDFFDAADFNVGGKKVSLNQLEKEILIKQTKDARLHFVLVCAAVGCPQIAEFAYKPSSLEAQMNERTELAMNSTYFTRVKLDQNKVELSQIFDWYKSDFTKGGKSLIEWVNQYRKSKIPTSYKVGHYEYDWNLNDYYALKGDLLQDDGDQTIAPPTGGSNLTNFTPSQLFAKGQYELVIFNNLYSQTTNRDRNGDETNIGVRQSIFSSRLQYTVGVSKSRKVNLGVDLVLGAGSEGPSDNSSLFQLFSGNNFSRDFAVTGINLRAKFVPFKKYPFYSIQTGFQFPVANDPEGINDGSRPFIALNRYVWNTQFFYDFKLSREFRLFVESSVQYLIRRNDDEVFFPTNFADLPTTAILNWFPTDQLNFFVLGQYFSRYGRTAVQGEGVDNRFGLLQWIVQLGGGVKYQATSQLSLEVSYGNFVAGRGAANIEAGAGQLVNFGIRLIK